MKMAVRIGPPFSFSWDSQQETGAQLSAAPRFACMVNQFFSWSFSKLAIWRSASSLLSP